VTATDDHTPQTAPVAGEMDSGGNQLQPSDDKPSPNGRVTTTLGDYVVNVRSDQPLAHIFQEAQPGAPERLFLRHYLEPAAGQVVVFEFDYAEGTQSFPVTENGFISITKDGQELVGGTGTVTIESMGADAIKVTFDQIAMVPGADGSGGPPSTPELIGNGVVEGPLRKSCQRATDVVHADDAAPTPAALHDAAWITQFCGE
jgi:hypothetical protein